jgi:hypothetical protein
VGVIQYSYDGEESDLTKQSQLNNFKRTIAQGIIRVREKG